MAIASKSRDISIQVNFKGGTVSLYGPDHRMFAILPRREAEDLAARIENAARE